VQHTRTTARSTLLIALAFACSLTVGAVGCSSGQTGGNTAAGGAAGGGKTAEAPPAKITYQPADRASDVSPTSPIGVSVAGGTISSVRLTNADGKVVKGGPVDSGKRWQVSEPLGYGKTYSWSGSAKSATGKTTPIAGSFNTVAPDDEVSGRLNVGDNKAYGVAMPISVTFDQPITDKASVERKLSVRTSKPTEGSWAWLDSQTVHWRPKSYWQPGTTVDVAANLYGTDAGDGVYGSDDVTSHFTIGPEQTVKADTRKYSMSVFRSGKQIATFPASYGLNSDPGRVTHNGTHVVVGKYPVYFMSNQQYGYRHVFTQWSVRISNNGEFIHAYPGSTYAQGNSNVSHGCVNLSTDNGKKYFGIAQVGDPVEVTGSSVPLGPKDGDYYDWTLDWNAWRGMSAL
jgi:lipoprotein-anchoring transpeptidase ErfK/SrfK